MDTQAKPNFGVVPMETMAAMSGLDFLSAISSGKLPPPPIADLIGFTLDEVAEGRAVFSGTPAFKHYNPLGSVHGGYAATLLDSCMGCAVHTTLKPGQGYTSLEIKVNFVRAVLDTSGRMTAEGRVIHAGKSTATAEGKLTDAKGKLLAHSTTTCMIFGG